MLKKTITYTSYDDEQTEYTEDFYFNLNEAELVEMQLSVHGGLGETIQRIVATKDTPELIKIFKDLIKKSYGVRTPDGKGFVKSEEVFKNFEMTDAYNKLFMELVSNPNAAAAFINGIVPSKFKAEAKKLEEQKA